MLAPTSTQSNQEGFVFEQCGPLGTYLEIGAAHPHKWSNTWPLERMGWQGLSIELDTQYKDAWTRERRNPIYWEDALTFDYAAAVDAHGFGRHLNYLSCDIDPAPNTFAALQRVIGQGLSFDCITFEHDRYRYRDADYHTIATEFLEAHGYRVAVYDVYWKRPSQVYETWYVRDVHARYPISYAEWNNI